MDNTQIYTFKTSDATNCKVNLFITELPPNSTANIHSTEEFSLIRWFVFYSVQHQNGRTEFFYDKIADSNESNDYVLNISYDSGRAICSFDSTKRIVFVDEYNIKLVKQNGPVFYEYDGHDYKRFLVIIQNNIFLFWHDDEEKVIVKTLNLSSFDNSSYSPLTLKISVPSFFLYTRVLVVSASILCLLF